MRRLIAICGIHFLFSLYFLHFALPDQDRLYTPDGRGYNALAINLIDHFSFSVDSQPPFEPDVFRTPIYPLFLVACYLLFGHTPLAPVLLQICLNLVTILLAYRLGRFLFGREASFWGCGLLAMSGVFVLHARYILTETLFTFILALVVCGVVWLIRSESETIFHLRRQTTAPAALGVLIGILTLCRPNGFYFVVVVSLLILFFAVRDNLSRRVKTIVIVFACFGLVVAPWFARNMYHYGVLRLDSNQSHVMYYITGGHIYALENESTLAEAFAVRRMKETGVNGLNPLELATKRQKEAIGEILAKPLGFMEVYLFGLAVTLSPISPKALALYLGDGDLNSSSAAELGILLENMRWDELATFITGGIGDLNWSIFLVSFFFVFVDLAKYWLCILAVILFYNSNRRIGLFLLLPVIAYFILVTGPLGAEATFRYRTPIEPYVSLLAGAGLCGIARTWSGFRDRRLMLSLLGFLLFGTSVGILRLFFSVSMV
jgi:4-amino-4-deoxy-L-arabinose transferase-like glycosyltransferase